MKEARFYQSPVSKQVMLEMSVPYLDQLEDGLLLLQPNSQQASTHSHLPVAHCENGILSVRVGETQHPMTEEHHIQWIYIQADLGGQFRMLHPTAPPEAEFPVNGRVHGIYAYCNQHGLWRLDGGDVIAFQDIAGPQRQQQSPYPDSEEN